MEIPETAEEALQPLIDFFESGRGAGKKIELTRRLGEALGTELHRQVVERWIQPNPARRQEPGFNKGLVLYRIGQEIMSEAQTTESKQDDTHETAPNL